jgi:hypothetical protein
MMCAMLRHPCASSISCVALTVALSFVQVGDAASITYMGVIYDRPDLAQLNVGNAGYWFPQLDAGSPVEGRPTGENPRDALPSWAGPLNHAIIGDPNFATRTFSQDGPARSKGGQPTWSTLKLPNGEIGLSGAIVDPHTIGNSNNTINRIQLNAGVPSTFYFHILTDNTDQQHDPTNRLRARGDDSGANIDPTTFPAPGSAGFNGIPDVYTFRYDGFAGGDFIKLQLNGAAAPAQGASFGGFLFDVTFEPDLTLPSSGDYNDDNLVDAADYVVWRKTYGDSGFFLPADGNPDNEIDAQDYGVWQTQYGVSGGSGFAPATLNSTEVPEASGVLFVVIAMVFGPGRFRGRSDSSLRSE